MSDSRACWLVVMALGYVQGRDTRLTFVSAAVLSVVGPPGRLLLLVVVLAVSARVVWWHISQGEEEGTSGRQEAKAQGRGKGRGNAGSSKHKKSKGERNGGRRT